MSAHALAKGLGPKQKRFAELYAQGGKTNYQCAVDAGYSKHSAGEMASENLRKPKIAKYVEAMRQEATKSTLLTIEDKRKFYEDLVKGVIEAPMKDRLRASELDSKLAGHDQPEAPNFKFKIIIGEE